METGRTPLLQKSENALDTAPGKSSEENLSQAKSFEYLSDPSVKSSVKQNSSPHRAFFTFFKGFVGCGILTLPYNFHRLGILPAIIIFVFLGLGTWYCMRLCALVADHLNLTKTDYPAVVKMVLGKNYKVAIKIIFILLCIVATTIQAVLALKFMELFSCNLEWESICDSRSLRVLLVLAVILPMTFITDVYYLSIPGAIATFIHCSFYAFVMILEIYSLVSDGPKAGSFESEIAHVDWTYLPTFFGTQIAAFNGIGLLFEVRGSLTKVSSFHNLLLVVCWALGILYILFGVLGAFAFSPSVGDELVFFYLPNTRFVWVYEFLYVLFLAVNYCVNLFPAVRLIENLKGISSLIVDKETGIKSKLKRSFIRYAVSGIAFSVALFVPSFNLLLGLFGSFTCVAVGFVFPILLYNRSFQKDSTKSFNRKFNWLMLVLWVILGSFGVAQSVKGLIEAFN